MKILALLSDQPYPPFSGSKVRNQFLWPELAKFAEIKVLGVSARPQDFSFSFPTKFFSYAQSALPQKAWNAFFYSFHQWPFSPALKEAVIQEVNAWQPDIIHAEELRMWPYIPHDFRGKSSCTFHNVETELLKSTGSSSFPCFRGISQKFHQTNLENFEQKCIKSIETIFAYSQVDQKILEKKYPEKKVYSTSGGVALHDGAWKNQSENNSILFTGSLAYWPNVEALHWFFQEIYPQIKNEVQVKVAGSNASGEIKELLRSNGATFYDSPMDLSSIYRESKLSIVPLRSGSGTRGKILESIGYGRMVITTAKGVEGLNLQNTEGVHIADDATTFANCIREYCHDSSKRSTIAQNGQQQIQQYSWDNVAKGLLSIWKN
jgi:glycosyltransferase involved in cell wall biosynthesis